MSRTCNLMFSYGSNLDPRTCRGRAAGAEEVGPAWLANHRLAFCGYSRGRVGGVATVLWAPGERVRGSLWRLQPEDWETMDRAEGVPTLYRRELMRIHGPNRRSVDAITYVMNSTELCAPSSGYLDVIARGYTRLGYNTETLHAAAEAAGYQGGRHARAH